MTKRKQAPERPVFPAVAIPCRVLDSRQFLDLPASAKALLFDVIRMHDGHNNGRLSITPATKIRKGGSSLSDRGWRSDDVLYRARDALLKSGLLVRTKRGGRNLGCDFFAAAWLPISNDRGLDIRSADHSVLKWIDNRFAPVENANAAPDSGVGSSGFRSSAVPDSGADRPGAVPESGAREGFLVAPAVPESGDHVNVAMYSSDDLPANAQQVEQHVDQLVPPVASAKQPARKKSAAHRKKKVDGSIIVPSNLPITAGFVAAWLGKHTHLALQAALNRAGELAAKSPLKTEAHAVRVVETLLARDE